MNIKNKLKIYIFLTYFYTDKRFELLLSSSSSYILIYDSDNNCFSS